jgi:hypothetical protein
MNFERKNDGDPMNESEMDPEIVALCKIDDALEPIIDVKVQARILWYISEKCGVLDTMLTMAARRYQ